MCLNTELQAGCLRLSSALVSMLHFVTTSMQSKDQLVSALRKSQLSKMPNTGLATLGHFKLGNRSEPVPLHFDTVDEYLGRIALSFADRAFDI
jgi:hypothetical protein